MRFSSIYAGAALGAAIALSACANGGLSQPVPGPAIQSAINPNHQARSGIRLLAVHHDRAPQCPSSQYYICFYISYGDTSPVFEDVCDGDGYTCAPQYYMTSVLSSVSHGTNGIKKHLTEMWSPNPFYPYSSNSAETYSDQYITELKPIPAKNHVQYLDEITQCPYTTNSSECESFPVGLIPQ